MSSLPIFLTSVANSSDEPCFPILFTWSTSDAQIKEVLVIPDDAWLDVAEVEVNQFDITQNQLYDFGFEASDILAEWTNELDTDCVYAFDADLVSSMVEKTYDCKNLDPSFEVASIHQWFANHDVDLEHELALMDLSLPAHLLPPDELIATLLQVAYQHELIELADVSHD